MEALRWGLIEDFEQAVREKRSPIVDGMAKC